MSDFIIQQPATACEQLFLILHGYGADANDLVPIGQILAHAFPQALVVSLAAPQGCEQGFGLQWFSLYQHNAPLSAVQLTAQVAQAVPDFQARIEHWQRVSSIAPSATALIGFSQGAMMALEATKGDTLRAGRVIAHSGRYVSQAQSVSELCSIHLIHGKADTVVLHHHALEAAETLGRIGADFTADVLPHLAHTFSDESIALMLNRLQSHVPKRLWDEALHAAKALKS